VEVEATGEPRVPFLRRAAGRRSRRFFVGLIVSGADRDLVFQDSELVARRASPCDFFLREHTARCASLVKLRFASQHYECGFFAEVGHPRGCETEGATRDLELLAHGLRSPHLLENFRLHDRLDVHVG